MAQLKILADGFQVASTWTVTTGSNGEFYISKGPYEGSKTVTFSYEIPDDVTLTSARVHSIWGVTYGPIGGYANNYPKVAGTTVGESNEWMADVSIDPDATSIDVEFVLKVIGAATSQGDKSSWVDVTDVYLLIEYEPNYTPPELVDYTDSDLVQGETYVKAVHMTELHTNINLIRVARKFAEYEFTAIVAMETSLAGWNNHVLEIRSAIDDMGISHEDWIELGENYPRLDVLLQLRRVVQAVSEA